VGRYRSRPRIWSLERVVAELQALHKSGELGSSHALVVGGHRELVSAAQRYAGSWEKAMRFAGIDYEPRREWTKDSVIREIRRLHRAGKSTAATKVGNALVIAASRRFGSWKKARAAALPSVAPPYKEWTKKSLLQELAQLHARGVSLSTSNLRHGGRGRLINAGVRLFGSWSNACQRAVPDREPLQQHWTRDRVLRAIGARHRDGKPMSATAVSRADIPLHAAAIRFFESWPVARKAAGVPYHDARNTWPPERIIAALTKLAPNGERPTIEKVGQALYKVACARFGTFEKACRCAGLRPRSTGPGLAEVVDQFERQQILRALRDHDGNIQRTADALRVKRQSLQRKIRRLDISEFK
jgi:hypothetical protein